jgi:hypothetical protein
MKRKMWLLAFLGAVLLSAGPAWAQDEFYVIAGGGVGTRITSLPYTITSPGFYYLTGNLSYSGTSNGINVNSDDLTLDLMGFSLSGPGPSASNYAIYMSGRKNVEIRNGTVSGWFYGIYEDSSAALRHRVINMRVESMGDGIYLLGRGHLIKGCTVGDCIGIGIWLAGGIASGNIVSNCALNGIYLTAAGNVIGNTIFTTGSTQYGIYIDTTAPNLVMQNTVTGPGTHFTLGSGSVNVSNAGF